MEAPVIVEAHGLLKRYFAHRALDGVDLAVPEGSVLALLGPNGAGKTTAVRVLTTLTRLDGGRATVAGADVATAPAAVRRVIGVTGQFAAVDLQQTGRENLTMIGALRHLGRAGARRRAAELLERFDLTAAADRRVVTWSGGMQRRLDLAMSLVAPPRVLFLDEPTTGLDPVSRAAVWAAVSGLVREGTTVVLTTQYLEEADRLADRIVLLDGGRVAAEGTAEQLKARVGGERLVLTFPDADARARARALPVAAGAVPGDRPCSLSLPSDGGAEHVRRVLDDLHAAGIPVTRVAGARPTLDDAFLALTGAHTGASAAAAVPVPA